MKYDVPIFHLNQRKPLNQTSKKKVCNGRDRTDLAPFTHIYAYGIYIYGQWMV